MTVQASHVRTPELVWISSTHSNVYVTKDGKERYVTLVSIVFLYTWNVALEISLCNVTSLYYNYLRLSRVARKRFSDSPSFHRINLTVCLSGHAARSHVWSEVFSSWPTTLTRLCGYYNGPLQDASQLYRRNECI